MALRGTIFGLPLLIAALLSQSCDEIRRDLTPLSYFEVDDPIEVSSPRAAEFAIEADMRVRLDNDIFDTDLPAGVKAKFLVEHRKRGFLTIVTAEGRVLLLKKEDSAFTTIATYTLDRDAIVLSVRFSYVPGLVYLYAEDKKLKKLLQEYPRQRYPFLWRRVSLTDETKDLQAIPWYDEKEAVANGVYRTDGAHIYLRKRLAQEIILDIPEPLDRPFIENPDNDLPHSVFVFPNNAIVCKLLHSWTVFSLTGKRLGSFPVNGIEALGWSFPKILDGQLSINANNGPSGASYRLDLENGRIYSQWGLGPPSP